MGLNKEKHLNINGISCLEAEVLKVAWKKGKVTVRITHEEIIKKEIEIRDSKYTPYTTILSIMTGLTSKGLLKQDRREKNYFYSAAVSSRELTSGIIRSVANKLLDDTHKKLIYGFLEDSNNITTEGIRKILTDMESLKK